MKLSELADLGTLPEGAGEVAFDAIAVDSREAGPNALFAAMPGTKVDGLDYAADAVKAGAVAVLAGEGAPEVIEGAPTLRCVDPRRALALAASRLHPNQPETIVAVTGTAGKTSVASFVRQIFEHAGTPAAMIGTTGVFAPGREDYGTLTTPDPVALHRLLDELSGTAKVCAMEASSHGLDQRRLDGVRLAAGAFTNLGRDHLDYHADMDEYLASKLRLFDTLLEPGRPAVVFADDEYAPRVVEACEARGIKPLTVGRHGLWMSVKRIEQEQFRQIAEVELDGTVHRVALPLAGEFQLANALVAAGLAIVVGLEPAVAFAALEHLEGASGRLELVGRSSEGAPVYIDYAHKPDALENVLKALQPYTTGRLVCVFGCGGDRDSGKRPLMGEIAARLADVVIVTDDNPRSEDPAAIRAAILEAAPDATEIADRREAIHVAVSQLRRGDTLVIAGKGHEEGQTIGDRTLPFSDQAVAREALEGAEHGAADVSNEASQADEPIPAAFVPQPPVGDIGESNDVPTETAPDIDARTPAQPMASEPEAPPPDMTTEPEPAPRIRPRPDPDAPIVWTMREMAEAMGAGMWGVFPEGTTGLSIDTRTIAPGETYFALLGDNHDGHDFVPAAAEAGAAAVIVAREKADAFADAGVPLLVVEDTLTALEDLGRAARARTKAMIVAVTGSVGKTTTKELLRTALAPSGKVHAAVASFNNHWGVPLTLARMPEDTDFGVIEIGMNHAGEIARLSPMAAPHVAIITLVAPAHLGAFATVNDIARAKAEIFDGLVEGGIAVINADDPRVALLKKEAEDRGIHRIVTFGKDADAARERVQLDQDSSRLTFAIASEKRTAAIGAPGAHIAQNALACLTACFLVGADMDAACEALAGFSVGKGRGERHVLDHPDGPVVLIDESYNANPASVVAAVRSLRVARPGPGGRRIAVLGDMLELGARSPDLHAGLSQALIANGIDRVLLAGPEMAALRDRLQSATEGSSASVPEARWFETTPELATIVADEVRGHDVVMVKSSLGLGFATIVDKLLEVYPPKG